MKKIATAILCSTVFMTSPVSADEPFEDEVKARQGYYQMVKFNFSVLGEMVKGNTEYNAETANTAAQNILALSQLNNGALWPKGSDNDSIENTKAKPEIWENFADVKEKSSTWKDAVATLAMEAGKGEAQLKSSFGPVGKACKACHDDYRAK